MPYKDKEKQKEATKERVRRYRNRQKGVTSEGVTGQGVTIYGLPSYISTNLTTEVPIEAPNEAPHNDYSAAETDVLKHKIATKYTHTPDGTFFRDGIEYVSASYVPGTDGKQYEMLPERPRYLTLSDKQVLDRANQPTSNLLSDAMLRANDNAFGYVPNIKPLPPELRRRFALKPAGKAV